MSSHLHRVCAFAWLSLSPPCSPVVSNVTLHCSWQTAQALFLLCVFTFSCSKESQVQQPSWPDHFLYDFTVSEDLISSSLTISPRDVHSLSSCLQITTNSFSVLLLFFQSSPNSAAGSVLSSPSMKWSGDSSPHHGLALWPHFILDVLLVTLGTSFLKAFLQLPPLPWILSLWPDNGDSIAF